MEKIPVPIGCTLTTAEFRARVGILLAQVRSGAVETEELPGGYAFRLPGDGQWLRLVADLIAAERECCPFLTFEVAALPNLGPLTVRVTGPAGIKEFLRTLVCKPEASP